jgi:hypothetical protein
MDSLKGIGQGIQDNRVNPTTIRMEEKPAEGSAVATTDSVAISGTPSKKPPMAESKKKTRSRTSKIKSESIAANRATAPTGAPSTIAMEETALPPSMSSTAAARSATRRMACEHLGDIETKLKAGELKDDAFANAVYLLADRAHHPGEDPLVRKMAKNILYTYVKGKTPVSEWMYKEGYLEGPTLCLHRINRSLQNSGDHMMVDPANSYDDFLKAIEEVTEGRRVPEDTVKAVSHLGRTIALRGDAKLSDEIRKKERPEDDRAMAGTFASLLEGWWQRGQIDVTCDGKPVVPGTIDLKEQVLKENVAVYGSSIALPAQQKKPSKKARDCAGEIIEGIDAYAKKDEQNKGVTQLEELCGKDRALAGEALRALIQKLQDSSELYDRSVGKLSRLIEEAAGKPALLDLLREQMPSLSTMSSRWSARESLIASNLDESAKVNYAGALVKAFPELLKAPGFFDREFRPLILCEEINGCNDACKLTGELWEKDPGLVKPTMDIILSDKDKQIYDSSQLHLMAKAGENYGWLPDREQAEDLLPRLHFPAGKDDISIFHGYTSCTQFTSMVKLFNHFRKTKPDLVEGLELPDHAGKMMPFGKALLDRLRIDSSKDLLEQMNARSHSGWNNGFIKDLYEMAFSDPKDIDELLTGSEKALKKAGSLDKLDRNEQMNLIIAASLDLDGEALARQKKMLSPFLTQKNIRNFSGIMDSLRKEEIEKGRGALASGSLSPKDRITLTDRLVKMQDIMSYSFDQERNREPIFASFREGFNRENNLPELRDLAKSLKSDAHLYRTCELISKRAPDDEAIKKNCGSLAELLDKVGGEEHFDVAADFFDFIDAELPRGRTREDLLKHCMRAYALGQDPRKTPWIDEHAPQTSSDVKAADEEGMIDIGGIKLEVNEE